MKQFNIIVVIVSLLLFTACKSKPEDTGLKVDAEIPVSVIPIEKGIAESIVQGSGLFSTDDETLLSFKNGGIIERIYVKEGDFIRKGQLLATLNMTELNAKSQQVKAAMQKAERDYARAQQLYKDSVATLEQLQNAKTGLDVIQQDWNTIEFNLYHSQIHAATDGYVLMKLANEGQVIGPGMPVFRVNGAGKGNWVVKIGISDREWAVVETGDSAEIYVDTHPTPIPGRVVRKAEGLDPQSLTFNVFVKPDNIAGISLATGMFGKVKIFGKIKDTWWVPYEALLDGHQGKGYVFVTDDNQTVEKVQVSIYGVEKDMVLISSGIENHKNVVVSGSPYLVDSSKIKIIE